MRLESEIFTKDENRVLVLCVEKLLFEYIFARPI